MSFRENIGKPNADPGPDQCEMIDAHHPDCTCRSCRMMVDVQCLEPAVGTVPENGNVRVCASCAKETERENDFKVRYYGKDRHLRRWFELNDSDHIWYLDRSGRPGPRQEHTAQTWVHVRTR